MADTKNYNLWPGTATIMTVLLVLLKVYGKINISWFWAFSPWIFSISLTLLFLLFITIIVILSTIFN